MIRCLRASSADPNALMISRWAARGASSRAGLYAANGAISAGQNGLAIAGDFVSAATLLGTTAINYTLVGDPGAFLQGIALAADWLLSERADACLVVGAEEIDWLTTDAFRLFDRKAVVSDGAGAGVKLRPAIYTSACSACNFNSSISGWFSDIADYNGQSAQTGTPWSTCASCDAWGSGFWNVWQYTSTGSVSGVSGNGKSRSACPVGG